MYRAPSEYNSEDLPFKPSVSRSGQEITPFPWKLSLCVCVFFSHRWFPRITSQRFFSWKCFYTSRKNSDPSTALYGPLAASCETLYNATTRVGNLLPTLASTNFVLIMTLIHEVGEKKVPNQGLRKLVTDKINVAPLNAMKECIWGGER